MRRLEIKLLASALADLDDVYDYVLDRSRSRLTADRYVDRLTSACLRIGSTPDVGTVRDDLGVGLRTLGFERRAVIVFRVEEDRVDVVNVLHGGRDIDAFYERLRRSSRRD